ncbi:hypothetical protein CCP3SC15_6920001 [Gammaproteobacteria bacterium]
MVDNTTAYTNLGVGAATDLMTLLSISGSAGQQDALQTIMDDHVAAVDTHRPLLASALMTDTVEAIIDSVNHWLPFGPYHSVTGGIMSETSYPYAATIDRHMTFVEWVQSVHVATTNNASNYWQINLYTLDDYASIGYVSTVGVSADVWANVTCANKFITDLPTTRIGLWMECAKHGSPGDLQIFSPTFGVHTHDANP